ncbi:MAG: hypothetical protein ACRDTG_22425 [Pseudonocardiaceae bacterium]
MRYGGRVMLAVAGGYVLGRTKKMKLAIMLAGMASGNKIARDPAQLLQQGTKLVQSNPQLSALSDQVRGRLVDAGKGIAVAVVSRRMDALSDRLSERTQRLSGRLDERTGSSRVTRSGRATDAAEPADDDWVDEDRAEDWGDEDHAEQERGVQQEVEPAPRHTAAAGTSGAGRRTGAGASPPRRRNGTPSAANSSERSERNA